MPSWMLKWLKSGTMMNASSQPPPMTPQLCVLRLYVPKRNQAHWKIFVFLRSYDMICSVVSIMAVCCNAFHISKLSDRPPVINSVNVYIPMVYNRRHGSQRATTTTLICLTRAMQNAAWYQCAGAAFSQMRLGLLCSAARESERASARTVDTYVRNIRRLGSCALVQPHQLCDRASVVTNNWSALYALSTWAWTDVWPANVVA